MITMPVLYAARPGSLCPPQRLEYLLRQGPHRPVSLRQCSRPRMKRRIVH